MNLISAKGNPDLTPCHMAYGRFKYILNSLLTTSFGRKVNPSRRPDWTHWRNEPGRNKLASRVEV